MTLRRIETDADRITTEPVFLSVGDVRRSRSVSRLKRILAVQALHDPEVAYCQACQGSKALPFSSPSHSIPTKQLIYAGNV